MPPEFKVSDHAKIRMKERIGCTEKKMLPLMIKAWNKGGKELKNYSNWQYANQFHGRPDIQFREMMGYLFIFQIYEGRPTCKLLVTVILRNHWYNGDSRDNHLNGKSGETV